MRSQPVSVSTHIRWIPVITSCVLLALGAGSVPLAAQGGGACAPETIDGVVRVDPGTGGEFGNDVAVLPDGSAVVVYSTTNDPGDVDRLGVVGRRLGSDGSPDGNTFIVNTWTAEDQLNARVAAAPNGRFAVVWQSDTSPGDMERASVRARVFRANGSPIGPDFRVNISTPGPQRDPDVAMADDGDFAVVWYDNGNFGADRGNEVRMRLYRADGTPRTGEIRVNTTIDGTQEAPAVAMRADGRVLVTWRDREGGGFVKARRFAADGTPLDSQEFRIDELGGGDPAVALDPDGSFMVAWGSGDTSGSDDSGRSVQVRGFLWSGAPQSPQRQINQTTDGHQDTASVAAAGDLEFLVVWRNPEGPGGDTSTDARGVTLQGQFLGGELTAIPDAGSGSAGGNGAGRTVVSARRSGGGGQILTRGYEHPCVGMGTVPGDCVEDATTACMVDDRFLVQIDWTNPNTEVTQAANRLDTSIGDFGDIFFFNNPNNPEFLIKVIPGCSINDHYWVFFAATTDVGFTVTVVDTERQVTKTYTNPIKHPADAVTETSAFATCP